MCKTFMSGNMVITDGSDGLVYVFLLWACTCLPSNLFVKQLKICLCVVITKDLLYIFVFALTKENNTRYKWN